MLLTALLAGLCALWSLGWLAGMCRPRPGMWRRSRWPLLLVAAVQCWVLLQLVPLPAGWIETLSPQAAAWRMRSGAGPLSLDPEATLVYLLRGAGLLAGMLLVAVMLDGGARLRLLLLTLVASGSLQALYGAFMVFSGMELGFFVEKYAGRGSATGTYVNSNHLAGYLVMCLSAGVGLLVADLERTGPGARGWRERLRRWLRYLLGPRMRLRFLLAVLVVALVMTRSRMGNLAFFIALGCAGMCLLATGQRFSWRVAAFLASLFLVDVLILGRWFGLDRLLQQLAGSTPGGEDRLSYYPAIVEYVASFPLTGSGGGSFSGVFPNFQPASVTGLVDHAHNDYLEFAAELGLPGLAMLTVLVLSSAWQAWRVLFRRRSALPRGAAFATLMTCAWLALHSATDFNLQIPANALTAAVLLMLPWVCRDLPTARSRHVDRL
jgi:O-antigen ligase